MNKRPLKSEVERHFKCTPFNLREFIKEGLISLFDQVRVGRRCVIVLAVVRNVLDLGINLHVSSNH